MANSITVGTLKSCAGFDSLSRIGENKMVLVFSELPGDLTKLLFDIYGTENIDLHASSGKVEVTIFTGGEE